MIENENSQSGNIYGSFFDQSTEKKNETLNINTDSINNDYKYSHYFCFNCNNFPIIKFCKDKKNVRLTCSCFNNKKISIEELFHKNDIKNNRANFLLESTLNTNIEKHLKCEKHNKIFIGFSKYFLYNYCEDCYYYIYEKYYNDIIKFDEIRIQENKIKEIFKKINDNKDLSKEI